MNIKLFQKILPAPKMLDVFNKESDRILESLRFYKGEENELPHVMIDIGIEESNNDEHSNKDVSNNASCTTCEMVFETFEEQREHFKLDWHRYNVKQKSCGKPILPEDVFEEHVGGELSSISGSDTEDDDLDPSSFQREISEDSLHGADSEVSVFMKHPVKSFYITKDSLLISFYRNIIKESTADDISEFLNVKVQMKNSNVWTYLLLSAGHFAAVVFEKNNVVAHKTFHRYTVRAKRGTIQGVHDKKQGQAKKSAGAALRRYNEAALNEDIHGLLESWSHHLKQSDKIFYKCSSYQNHVLFDGKCLSKDDKRVSKISVATNRPTFKEVKRIHQLFSTFEVYGPLSSVKARVDYLCQCSTTKSPVINNITGIDNSPEPKVSSPKASRRKTKKNKEKNDGMKGDAHLKKKEKTKTKEKPQRILNELEILWNNLYKQIKDDETIKVKDFINGKKTTDTDIHPEQQQPDNTDEQKMRIGFLMSDYLNFCSPDYGETLLHAAVKQNDTELITDLLLANADPTKTNFEGKVPYDTATTKPPRNSFRRFMAKYPDKYNYEMAKIPSPLTEEMEQEQHRKAAEKKKQQQKAKKEKMKAKKAIEREEKKMEKEQKAFEALSDREKRAVMAERRFASQLTNTLRCANCRANVNEKQAFERFEYKYCSIDCVQTHKKVIGR